MSCARPASNIVGAVRRSRRVADHVHPLASFVESAGRSVGTERYVGTTEEEQWDNKYDKNKRNEHTLDDSHIGFARHLHPQLNHEPFTDVRLHRFDSTSERLRGLAGNDFDFSSEGYWDYYDMPPHQGVLSASCNPRMIADIACYEVLHPIKVLKKGGKRPAELHIVLLCE